MSRPGALHPRAWSLMLLALAACAAGDASRTFVYTCGEDYRFTVRFEDDVAWLYLPDRTLRLPHVIAASGARYSDGQVTFWSKGTQALLETGTQRYTDCQSRPAKTSM